MGESFFTFTQNKNRAQKFPSYNTGFYISKWEPFIFVIKNSKETKRISKFKYIGLETMGGCISKKKDEPTVKFTISKGDDNEPLGEITIILFINEVPKTAKNFLA